MEQLLNNGGLDADTEDACLLALFHLGYHMQTQVRCNIIIKSETKYFRPRCPMKFALNILITLLNKNTSESDSEHERLRKCT